MKTVALCASLLLALSVVLLAAPAPETRAAAAADEGAERALWPEAERAFLDDGPGWLLPEADRRALMAMDEAERAAFVRSFFAGDPDPSTPQNELEQGIERRRRLVLNEVSTFLDDRARLLFLQGEPVERLPIRCDQTFEPLEIWWYGPRETSIGHVLYQPRPGNPYRLWLPLDSKRVLYGDEMERWLEEVAEITGGRGGPRFDRRLCKQTEIVDRATGVDGLFGYREDRPTNDRVLQIVAPPQDLGAWARAAAATALPEPPPALGLTAPPEVYFPEAKSQRMVARFLVRLPETARLEPFRENETSEVRLKVDGVVEHDGELFEEFHIRFQVPVGGVPTADAASEATEPSDPTPEVASTDGAAGETPDAASTASSSETPGTPSSAPPASATADADAERSDPAADAQAILMPAGGELALLVDRLLRPQEAFLVRFRIRDEVGGAESRATVGFRVPATPQLAADLPADVTVARGVDVEPDRVPGVDSLIIIPPETDVVLGLWRVETLISGERIRKVVFLLDGKPQFTRSQPPFQAEMRLAKYPTEHVVRVEGYDTTDQLVASDEVILNQQRGQLEVRVVEPRRGVMATGTVRAKASVVIPEERKLERVEFLVDDQIEATLVKPPWEADIEVPATASQNDVHYLTVAAYLDDGTRAEDVQFLNSPDFVEEVDVDLVELYTTIEGQPPAELTKDDFSVFEDGRPQQIVRFELVRDLPITIGITIDTSGSMIESLGEAKRAAIDFLDNILTPKDQSFAVSFSNHPVLLMTRTSDVGAVAAALDDLHAIGNTALHDSVVTSLYYFRGVRGRRAMVLLSDGEDTASNIPWKDALDYARKTGVVIYPIGLNIGMAALGVRDKLNSLAGETGGRAFYISKAAELHGVYDVIEEELRSQYLITYSSDARPDSTQFRAVEVKMRNKMKARTISGYYP